MKIGIVTTWFARGAAYVSRQYKNVWQEEHDVFIYARGGEAFAIGDATWDGPEVTWGKRDYRATTAVNLEDFKKWLMKYRIDMVFFNEQKWWPAVILCNDLGILNGAYIDYYTEELIPIYGLHDFLICNTKRHLSAFEWHDHAYYIPWGTDTEIFKPHGFDLVKKNRIIFFHSAGMAPERKGLEYILEAFSKIDRTGVNLIIHTQLELDEIFIDKKEIIRTFQNEGFLEVITETVEAPGLYHLGDVYLYPTKLEGIGLTIAEAISSGLPAIVPHYPPMNEFVNSDSGWLIDIEKNYCRADGYYWPMNEISIISLVNILNEVIANKNSLSAIKKSSREFALKKLNWNTNKNELLNIIKDLKKIDPSKKKSALLLAMEYQKKRKNNPLKEWVQQHELLHRLMKKIMG